MSKMPATRKNKQKNDDAMEDDDSNIEIPSKQYTQEAITQWMFFVNEEAVQHNPDIENKPVIAALKHPRTEKRTLFLFSNEDKNIYEVNHFKEEFRSWLIGETVHGDGSIFITTEVDPIFLALPYLIQAAESGKFMTLDQIISDEEYPECNRLHTSCENSDLETVADIKGADDLKAYKYDKDKTLSWLKLKTERVSDVLSARNVNVSGARVEELIQKKATDEEYLRYAHGIVSDYLPVELGNSLREYLGLPAIVEKRPSDAKNPPAKRAKLEDITPAEDYSKNVKLETKSNKGKQTAAQKMLDKVDKSGMKSMMSFFSPKAKS